MDEEARRSGAPPPTPARRPSGPALGSDRSLPLQPAEHSGDDWPPGVRVQPQQRALGGKDVGAGVERHARVHRGLQGWAPTISATRALGRLLRAHARYAISIRTYHELGLALAPIQRLGDQA